MGPRQKKKMTQWVSLLCLSFLLCSLGDTYTDYLQFPTSYVKYCEKLITMGPHQTKKMTSSKDMFAGWEAKIGHRFSSFINNGPAQWHDRTDGRCGHSGKFNHEYCILNIRIWDSCCLTKYPFSKEFKGTDWHCFTFSFNCHDLHWKWIHKDSENCLNHNTSTPIQQSTTKSPLSSSTDLCRLIS